MSMSDLAAQDSYEIDPMTGAVMNPSPYAQGKFERILGKIGGGLRDWFQTPGRAFKEGLTPEEATNWGAGTALSMLGVGAPVAMTAPARGASAGIFGGKLAETADMAALRQARALEKTGTEPGAILDATGWEKRPDKQWRFEINDRDAAMKPGQSALMRSDAPPPGARPDVTVSDVFHHPDLYAAYPWVGEMPARSLPAVDKFGQPNTMRGGYDPQSKAVYLRENLTPQEARLTMLHEAQHAIQGEEGFAQGGSLSSPSVVRRGDKQLEQTISAAEQRFNTLRDQMLNEVSAKAPSGNPTRAQIDKWKADNPALAIEMDRAFDTFSAPGGANRSASRFEAYRSLQGETEARNVSRRADLIPEQRYLLRPEVTEDVARAQQWMERGKRGKMGEIADTAMPGMMQDTAPPVRLGSILAPPEEINRAAAASAKGVTQPELRKLYGELGLTGGAPSELVGPSLAAKHDPAAIQATIDLKLADRAALDTLSPKQRQQFALGGKAPEGFTLPSREAGAADRAAFKPLKKEITQAEAAFDADVAAGNRPSIFDLSPKTLMQTPDVAQFNLPRVAPEATERLGSVARGGLQRIERAAAAAPEENWGWYNLDQARDRFREYHGATRGDQAFNAWLDSVAGTSMVNPIDNNLRSSTWYLQQMLEGKPLPETMQVIDPVSGKATKTMVGGPPAGYGAKSQIQHADRVREYVTNSYDPVTNPKPISYRMNLGGNWMPRTVDTHDIRNLVGMPAAKEIFKEDAALLPKEYAYLEKVGQRASDRAGASQAAQQAATWVGGGEYTGLKSYPAPLMEALNRRAHVTGAVRGISAEQALKEAFTGKKPLLGLGGAAVVGPSIMGGLASQDRYE